MKKITLLFVFALASNILFAQNALDTLQETKLKYGIGLGAGFATGYGLSFRYVPKKFGAQINFAPLKNSDLERYSLGVTFLYTLMEHRVSNLYLYQANHYYYNSEMVYVYDPLLPEPTKVRETEQYMNNGLGVGIEIIMGKRVGLNLMAGYAFYNNLKQLNVTGEAALYYKF